MRFPILNPAEMSQHQRDVSERIARERVGGLCGPLEPLIHSPEVAERFQILDEYLRFNLRLPERLRALAVLVAAGRHRASDVGYFAELKSIRESGLENGKIKALSEGRRPDTLTEDEEMIHKYCTELTTTGSVKNVTFNRVVERFGREICMELVVLCGHIALTKMFINITEVAFPAEQA